jgi:hypothetical protein
LSEYLHQIQKSARSNKSTVITIVALVKWEIILYK